MKKIIATLVTVFVLSMTALPVAAQTRTRSSNRTVNTCRSDSRQNTRYNHGSQYRNDGYRNDAYNNDQYDNANYRYGQNRSVWDKHRDKITTAGGAVGGAILGGLIGGKKGAIIGAITGGGGAAVYTYKIRNKNQRY